MANGQGGPICGPTGACENYNSPGPNVADGQWHFIAVTVQRLCHVIGGTVFVGYLYVDGVQVLTFVPRSANISNNAWLLIGKLQPAFGRSLFQGCIDELEIFKRAVTPSEVFSIWARGSYGKCR
jgi:hypothetical protein